ncbi:MAG: hypothetical protein L0220_14165 [Acidobacteria bacterium]|nr:hypothetical protein [Acidobacteriota bacterium]
MSRKEFGKLLGNVAVLGMLVTCLVFLTANTKSAGFGVFWRQPDKKVISHSNWRTEPVKFIKVKAAGKEVSFKEEFDSDDEWMRGLIVTLKNTSNKNIIHIRFLLQFPEAKFNGVIMATLLEYGKYPNNPSNGNYDKLLKPGEEVDLVLPDTNYSELRSFLASKSFYKVNALHIHLDSVIYDDDTMWSGNALFMRDPNKPNAWINIKEL